VPNTDDEATDPTVLRDVLLSAREAGFLGPGPIERHLRHAEGFVSLARAQTESDSARLLDLGSGGGLPGLVIAEAWPTATLVLLEANERRAQFLERAVITCGFQERVQVVHLRAEIAGRDSLYRGSFDGVVVRSFGGPAVVAECSAPLLRKGGWLIVSEPPGDSREGRRGEGAGGSGASLESPVGAVVDPSRWPPEALAQFGLEPVEFIRDGFGYQIMRQVELCPEKFPRRDGVPAKKPLF
jgi:16S rRNA (guanine527-N7)-methyltransferase